MEQLKPDEALAQISYLREIIEETKERAAAGWFFYIVWGVAWTIGYLGTAFAHAPAGRLPHAPAHLELIVWISVVVGAFVLTGLAGGRGSSGATTRLGRQYAAINMIVIGGVAVFAFIVLRSTHLADAYWPFWFGVLYLVNGVLLGRELMVFGGWLIGAALVSLAMPVWVQALWLAPCAGGAFVLTGVLFRRQLRAS